MVLPFGNKRLRDVCIQKPVTTHVISNDMIKVKAGLLRLLEKLLLNQKVIEVARESFREHELQELCEAFQMISGGNYLKEESIERFMNSHSVCLEDEDIKELILRLDKDQDGKLSLKDFIEEIFPQPPPQDALEEYEQYYSGQDKVSDVKEESPEVQYNNNTYAKMSYKTSNVKSLGRSPNSATTANTLLIPNLDYLLKSQLDISIKLENAKQQLQTLDLIKIFQLFDRKQLGTITLYEMSKVFKELKVKCSHESMCLLMRRYDRDGDGKLDITEFESMFKPLDFISCKAEYEQLVLEKYLRKLIESEEKAEEVRNKIGDLNALSAFNTLDKDQKGYILPLDVLIK